MNQSLQNNNIEKNLVLLKKRALYYLGKREYSREELHKKITPFSESLEITRQQVNQILTELESKDWLSDRRFADQFVFSKKRKFGLKKMGYELKMHGVDEIIIHNALNEIKSEEYNLAKNIWEKKFRKLPENHEERLKQMRFLQSRGINSALIHQILSGKLSE
jgi:regulatory protein